MNESRKFPVTMLLFCCCFFFGSFSRYSYYPRTSSLVNEQRGDRNWIGQLFDREAMATVCYFYNSTSTFFSFSLCSPLSSLFLALSLSLHSFFSPFYFFLSGSPFPSTWAQECCFYWLRLGSKPVRTGCCFTPPTTPRSPNLHPSLQPAFPFSPSFPLDTPSLSFALFTSLPSSLPQQWKRHFDDGH